MGKHVDIVCLLYVHEPACWTGQGWERAAKENQHFSLVCYGPRVLFGVSPTLLRGGSDQQPKISKIICVGGRGGHLSQWGVGGQGVIASEVEGAEVQGSKKGKESDNRWDVGEGAREDEEHHEDQDT